MTVYAKGNREDWRWFAGCFAGDESQLRDAIKYTHGDDKPNGRCYIRAIDYLIETALDERNAPLSQTNKD